MQLILDTQQGFRFRVKDGLWHAYGSLIIREQVIHQLDTHDSVQLIIYLDPHAKIAKTIKSQYLGKMDIAAPPFNIFHFINAGQLQQAILQPSPCLLKDLVNRVLEGLTGKSRPVNDDERISRVEQHISSAHPLEISVKSLANSIFLSESRLRALFKQKTGVSLYRYMIWNRIRFATNRILAGYSVEGAALDAGFTDSSHFHKILVQMFGISPSNFLKNSRLKNFVICDQPSLRFETCIYRDTKWEIDQVIRKSGWGR